MFDQNTLDSAWGETTIPQRTTTSVPPKKSGGVSGFLGNVVHGAVQPFNYLAHAAIVDPAREIAAQVTGNKKAAVNARKADNANLGLGNKGTDFTGGLKKFVGNSAQALLDVAAPGVSSIKGGAALGAATGASSSLADRNSSLGSVLEGGLAGGATGGALSVAGKVIGRAATKGSSKTNNGFWDNLTTQGQQAQGRVTGLSAGSKVAGKELVPQDTERMLGTLKKEGIKTGNANNTLRDVHNKLEGYGQQIADHFKTNDAPLGVDDTQVIAGNFAKTLKTTDPGVLAQAKILADDLEKNVKSTKDLWEFRKTLDNRIPDTKQGNTLAVSNKIEAVKSMRQYIADELGNVPGMKNYHDLSEIKPFVFAEAHRLNNPSGGIVGRVLSSGVAQKAENTLGKGTEAIANGLRRNGTGSIDTLTPMVTGTVSPKTDILQASMNALHTPAVGPAKNFATGALRQGITAQAGGLTAPGGTNTLEAAQSMPNLPAALTQASSNSPVPSNNPFDPVNAEANVQAILQQGGTQKDVAEYLSNVKSYQDLTAPPTPKSLSSAQQTNKNNAVSALQDIQALSKMLDEDSSLALKDAVPGGGIAHRLTGTTDYDASKRNITDILGHLRTGAAISAQEEQTYKGLLPGFSDPSESAKAKLVRLARYLAPFSNPNGSSSDVNDLLSSVGN